MENAGVAHGAWDCPQFFLRSHAFAVNICCALLASLWLSAAPPEAGVSPADLDRSISEVIGRQEYTWRFPRERIKRDETEKGWFTRFVDGMVKTAKDSVRATKSWIRRFNAWWDSLWRRYAPGPSRRERTGIGGWSASTILLFALLTLVACTLAVVIWRFWTRRRRRPERVIAEKVALKPNLADENVAADQLPEDGWTKLAGELMQQGELRLALRALYLASLAHLAERELIHIAKYKSNRDYEVELQRRVRALPDLQAAFGHNVTIFDRMWYGMHDVSRDTVNQFHANLERIRAS